MKYYITNPEKDELFECEYCNKGFLTKYVRPAGNYKLEAFVCDYCIKGFYYYRNANPHDLPADIKIKGLPSDLIFQIQNEN